MKQQDIANKMKTQSSKKSHNGITDDGQLSRENYFEQIFPFSIIANKKTGGKVKLAMGNYLLSFEFETVEEAKKAIKTKSWELIMEVIGVYIALTKKVEEGKL